MGDEVLADILPGRGRRAGHAALEGMPLVIDGYRTALRNRFLKQAFRARRHHQVIDGYAAGRMAEDRDIIRIAAKCADIFLHPFERRDLVHESVVHQQFTGLQTRHGRMCKAAEKSHPVIDRHQHNTFPGENAAVVNRVRTRTKLHVAAMDIEHHG